MPFRTPSRGLDPRLGALLTLAAAALFGFVTTRLPVSHGEHPADVLAVAAVVVTIGAVALASRRPFTAACAAAVAVGVYVARHYPNGPILAAGLLTMLLASRFADRRRTLAATVIVAGCVLIGSLVRGADGTVLGWFYAGWTIAAAALGDAWRSRRRIRAEQTERLRSDELTRQAETLRRLAEQRLSIARDLHDGVAHAMATINVQAAAAARVMDRRPAAAKDALAAIARASGTVLDDLNAVVAVLRNEHDPVERAPQPGLADLAELVSAASTDRLTCHLDRSGDPTAVTETIGTAVYRIVQESLTNALRHSHGRHVNVRLIVGDRRTTLTVTDDGTGPGSSPGGSPGGGSGIAGMRERARATGGELETSRAAGGFEVRASWVTRTATADAPAGDTVDRTTAGAT